jgi:hypothetical protein
LFWRCWIQVGDSRVGSSRRAFGTLALLATRVAGDSVLDGL